MDRFDVRNQSVHIIFPIDLFSASSLRELHARGTPREDIEHALRIMPFVRITLFSSI